MSENNRIRVVIADDQELVRAGFAMVIGSQPDMDVIGQAGDGARAVELAARLRPDVVLMDVRMPGMDGIEATRRIIGAGVPAGGSDGMAGGPGMGAGPEERTTRVIILTTFDLDEYVMAAINAGASGFLLKDTEPETLLASIRTVFQGNAIIAPSATKRLIEKMMHDGQSHDQSHDQSHGYSRSVDVHDPFPSPVGSPSGPSESDLTGGNGDGNGNGGYYTDPELELLTDREREVLVEIAHGLSNQEIADKLFIGLPTVKTHVAHILSKIHARDRVQAVVFAYENRLV